MTARFLLDTNIVSEPLRPQPDQGVLHRLRDHQAECAIASIVWHELVFGAERLPISAKREVVQRYLTAVIRPTLPFLDYGERSARWHGVERARLAALGRTPPFVDGQIAAIAAVNGLTLLTANLRDFAHFSDLDIVNWFVE